MGVVNGVLAMDAFFTFSAIISFYQINKMYNGVFQKKMGPLRILGLFVYRFLRFAPILYLIFFFGLYVMPRLHGGGTDTQGNPIWPAFE